MDEQEQPTTTGMVEVKVEFTASGFKSSEGDGRTAADIEAERSAESAGEEDQ